MKDVGKDLNRALTDVEDTSRDVIKSAEIARAVAEIQASFAIAVKRPRDEMAARDRMKQAVKQGAFAKTCFYSFPRARTEIFGPSINLAKECARVWGNFIVGYRIMQDDDESRTIEAYAWDLETNTRYPLQDTFKKRIQRKDYKTGLTSYIEPDERDLRELTAKRAAIQMRNAIFDLLPRDFVDELVDLARAASKKGKIVPNEFRRQLLTNFGKMGVYVDRIDYYCLENYGHKFDATNDDELQELEGVVRAIKDGVASRDEYFGRSGAPRTEEKPPPVKHEITMPKMDVAANAGDKPDPKDYRAEYDLLFKILEKHKHEIQPVKAYTEIITDALKCGTNWKNKAKFMRTRLMMLNVDVEAELELLRSATPEQK